MIVKKLKWKMYMHDTDITDMDALTPEIDLYPLETIHSDF